MSSCSCQRTHTNASTQRSKRIRQNTFANAQRTKQLRQNVFVSKHAKQLKHARQNKSLKKK